MTGFNLFDLIWNLSNELISARVRMRALLELLEEKGVLLPGEFEARAQAVWERDHAELARELAPELFDFEPADRT